MSGVSDDVLKVHGVMTGIKKEGITRLLYENCNSLSNRICGNNKLEKMKDLIHEWDADIVKLVKHRQNLHHKSNTYRWNQLCQRADKDVRSVVAHNSHKNIAPVQEGGSGLLVFGLIIDQLDMKSSGKDGSGLGRWTMVAIKGDRIQTRIICGYNPCKPSEMKRVLSSTSYAQHRQ